MGDLREPLPGRAGGGGVSGTLSRIQALVAAGDYRLSDHAYQKLEERDILPTQIVNGLQSASVVEEYPDAERGPTILVLVRDQNGGAIHALWGMPRDGANVAVLITAYRPNADEWTPDFTGRIKT